MKALMFTGLETAVNQVLRLDPPLLAKLHSLQGKTIQIILTDWDTSIYIEPYAQGLHLLSSIDKTPDTIIQGKLINLLRVGMAGATTTALFDESIAISGDTKTGETMRDLLRELDIDWEEHLSKILGDSLAHSLTQHFKKTFHFGKKTLRAFRENIAEYLHYESKQLPTATSIETFYQAVDTLRNDVDRLEARIRRLSAGKKHD